MRKIAQGATRGYVGRVGATVFPFKKTPPNVKAKLRPKARVAIIVLPFCAEYKKSSLFETPCNRTRVEASWPKLIKRVFTSVDCVVHASA